MRFALSHHAPDVVDRLRNCQHTDDDNRGKGERDGHEGITGVPLVEKRFDYLDDVTVHVGGLRLKIRLSLLIQDDFPTGL